MKNAIKRVLNQGFNVAGIPMSRIAKPIGKAVKRVFEGPIDVKSAASGLEALKKRKGFDKLDWKSQQSLIRDYINKIPIK